MPQGSRASRVGDQIRAELASLLTREVHDPGIGFLTITSVKVSPDLQQARVYYTTIGDEKAQRETARALQRATPFLRRHVGRRLRSSACPSSPSSSTSRSRRATASNRSSRNSHDRSGPAGPTRRDGDDIDDPGRR